MTAPETPSTPEPLLVLDLRDTKCPLNFVKTKLALEKRRAGEVIEVWILEEGPSAINIPQSIAQEGHAVVQTQAGPDGLLRLWIEKRAGNP